MDVADVGGPSRRRPGRSRRSRGRRRPCGPTGRAGGRPGSGPRSRCRRRTARRSRGPARPAACCSSRAAASSARSPRIGSDPTTRSAASMALLARRSWRCTRPRPGKRPVGHHDRLAVGVVERVLGEPASGPGRRAARSGAGSARPRPPGRRSARGSRPRSRSASAGDGDDGGHHQVDGDHVGHALRARRGTPAAGRGRRR